MEISNKSGVGICCKCGETVLIDTTETDQYISRLETAFLKEKCSNLWEKIESDDGETVSHYQSRVLEKAREALEQIRSSNHIVEANLVLTAEQREAVQYLIELATDGKYPPYPGGVLAEKIEILRSLLDGKAGGKDEFTNG